MRQPNLEELAELEELEHSDTEEQAKGRRNGRFSFFQGLNISPKTRRRKKKEPKGEEKKRPQGHGIALRASKPPRSCLWLRASGKCLARRSKCWLTGERATGGLRFSDRFPLD